MANKRVKGVKVDLAALYDGGPNALPTGPSGDPSREYNRGGRGGGRGGYGDRDRDGGYGSSNRSRGGGFGDEDDWGRNQERGNIFRSERGERSGGYNDSGFDRPSGGGLRRNDNYSAPSASAERPAHLRLNLQPRAGAAETSEKQGNDTVETATNNNKDDKWDSIFKSSQQPRSNDARRAPAAARSSDVRNTRGGDDEIALDPRFASKFGSRNYNQDSDNGEFQTVPSSRKTVIIPLQQEVRKPSEADLKKQTKAAQRLEQEKKLKEEKEAKDAAIRASKEAKQAAEASASKVATEIVASGKKGDALSSHIKSVEVSTTVSAFVNEVLSNLSTATDLTWCKQSEYGCALKTLGEMHGVKAQVDALYAIQVHCHNIKFPKVDSKGQQKYYIELLFNILYGNELIDDAAFQAWADDDNDDYPGRVNAIVQTTAFISFLNEAPDADEQEDEDDIDAPREFIQ